VVACQALATGRRRRGLASVAAPGTGRFPCKHGPQTTCPRGPWPNSNQPAILAASPRSTATSRHRGYSPPLRWALPPPRCRHILDRATHRPHRPPRKHSRSSRRRPQHCCPSSSSEHPRSVTHRWINKSRAEGHSANGYRAAWSDRLVLRMHGPTWSRYGKTPTQRSPSWASYRGSVGFRSGAGGWPSSVSEQ